MTPTLRRRLAELGTATARRYFAQLTAGENPWNSVHPSEVPQEVIDSTEIPDTFTAPIINAPVVLVFTVDLSVVASVDQNLDRVGLASGASVYPLIWNILLAARNEGYGGTITTMAIAAGGRKSAGCWESRTTTRSPRSCRSASPRDS